MTDTQSQTSLPRSEDHPSFCLLQALALNLGWAHTLRHRIAAAAALAVPAIA
jgi:hypothetical protein